MCSERQGISASMFVQPREPSRVWACRRFDPGCSVPAPWEGREAAEASPVAPRLTSPAGVFEVERCHFVATPLGVFTHETTKPPR